MRLSSKTVLEFLESKGDFKTEKWSIPSEIKNGKDELKCALARGIFDSEGYSTYSGRARRVELEMKNRDGIVELKNILEELGVYSQVEQSGKKEKKDTYLLRIYDRKSIERFKREVGFSIQRKQDALVDLLKSYEN